VGCPFLCAGSLLSAEELFDITLHFTPATGGSPEERAFFDAHLPGEIKGEHYGVVDSGDEADFLVSTVITGHEDRPSCVTLGLITAANNSLLMELFWDFVEPREMYSWNVGAILAPEAPEYLSAASNN
jgi:hypothetical protein